MTVFRLNAPLFNSKRSRLEETCNCDKQKNDQGATGHEIVAKMVSRFGLSDPRWIRWRPAALACHPRESSCSRNDSIFKPKHPRRESRETHPPAAGRSSERPSFSAMVELPLQTAPEPQQDARARVPPHPTNLSLSPFMDARMGPVALPLFVGTRRGVARFAHKQNCGA
jgi:hypothetical protein